MEMYVHYIIGETVRQDKLAINVPEADYSKEYTYDVDIAYENEITPNKPWDREVVHKTAADFNIALDKIHFSGYDCWKDDFISNEQLRSLCEDLIGEDDGF